MSSAGKSQKTYSTTLIDEEVLANVIYGLSNVQHQANAGSGLKPYAFAAKHVRDCVDMLNGIALLLVYEESGDVVATGLNQDGAKYTLYWAKNDTVQPTVAQRDYLTRLETCFKSSDNAVDALTLVVTMCKKKIISRVKKMTRTIRENAQGPANVFGVDKFCRKTEELRRHLVMNNVMMDHELHVALDNFFTYAEKLTNASTTHEICRVLFVAYWLTGPRPNLEWLKGVYAPVLHRVRKVGDYHRACVRVMVVLHRMGTNMRSNFSIVQIPPPPAKNVSVLAETIKALNIWADHFPAEPIETFDDLKEVYPGAREGSPGLRSVKISQHCELTLGLYLWKIRDSARQSAGAIEIGCSKSSCLYCGLFIEKFNEWALKQPQVRKMVTCSRHCKYIDGWAMPRCPPEVSVGVLEEIGNKIDDVFINVTGPRRRSDSHCLSGSFPGLSETELLERSGTIGPTGI
ncbi:MAG: hypothetical protein L6R39_007131 [Caloplaca ligustica]|nr:MAG: hypothetical protein L6R39_007131 [Caloplaca ligustica]